MENLKMFEVILTRLHALIKHWDILALVQEEYKKKGNYLISKTKPYQIWMEGYRATGEHGEAQRLYNLDDDSPFVAHATSFDEAVERYKERNPSVNIVSKEGKHSIWACNLYPTEEEARKTFG